MADASVRCVLVEIHGIGNQSEDWSAEFERALGDELAAQVPALQLAAFKAVPVRWSDITRSEPSEGIAGLDLSMVNALYALVRTEYTSYLAGGGPSGGPLAGVGSFLGGIFHHQLGLAGGATEVSDHVDDVASYVANNGLRLAIMERLASKLLAAQEAYPKATIVLGSHSQGTIIAYDVLRLSGAQLVGVKHWVTMGSPLHWYLTFGNWGSNQLELPAMLAWLNLYDPQDIVGQRLAELLSWPAPKPQDVDVDNVGQVVDGKNLDAHDHWRNPVVVQLYTGLIAPYIA